MIVTELRIQLVLIPRWMRYPKVIYTYTGDWSCCKNAEVDELASDDGETENDLNAHPNASDEKKTTNKKFGKSKLIKTVGAKRKLSPNIKSEPVGPTTTMTRTRTRSGAKSSSTSPLSTLKTTKSPSPPQDKGKTVVQPSKDSVKKESPKKEVKEVQPHKLSKKNPRIKAILAQEPQTKRIKMERQLAHETPKAEDLPDIQMKRFNSCPERQQKRPKRLADLFQPKSKSPNTPSPSKELFIKPKTDEIGVINDTELSTCVPESADRLFFKKAEVILTYISPRTLIYCKSKNQTTIWQLYPEFQRFKSARG
jgi:hypothetical protein